MSIELPLQAKLIKCEQFDQQGIAKVIRQSRFGQKSWNESLYINREGKIFPQQVTPDSLSKFYPAIAILNESSKI